MITAHEFVALELLQTPAFVILSSELLSNRILALTSNTVFACHCRIFGL